jgi:hypothetical protein
MNDHPRRSIRIVGGSAVMEAPLHTLQAAILDQAALLYHLVRQLEQASPGSGVEVADATASALLHLAQEFGAPPTDAA